MEHLQLSCPVPVEDVKESVEESHYMDTSENCNQVFAEQYGPFHGFQAMEGDLFPPDNSSITASAIQYIQNNGRQYSISNSQLVPPTVNIPVTETGSELALTLEVNDKLAVQQSENKSGSDLFDEIWSMLNSSIPRAEELSIQPHGSDSIGLDPQTNDTEEKYEGAWDSTHQPMDELEPLSPMSTEMAIPGMKKAVNITHDHSYGTKENSLRGLDMNKDEDLHKGLNLAMEELREIGLMESFVDVKKSMTKRPPKNVQDSQEALKNSVRNRRYLLRELRYVRVVADIRKLPTDKLRQLVPRLVRFLFYQQDDPNRKGIYKVAPLDWPETKFFGDPCNRIAEGGRPRKDMIVEMSCELFTRYQKVHASMTEDSVKNSVEATN